MSKSNLGSNVQSRENLSLSPSPMYVKNELGHKCYKELGGTFSTRRTKSTLWVEDTSNESGKRAKGGY